jgi:hypothetical protein
VVACAVPLEAETEELELDAAVVGDVVAVEPVDVLDVELDVALVLDPALVAVVEWVVVAAVSWRATCAPIRPTRPTMAVVASMPEASVAPLTARRPRVRICAGLWLLRGAV